MPPDRISLRVEQPQRRFQPREMETAGRAFAYATVAVGSREWFTRFLVDTGASFTLLSAGDAEDLLVEDYFEIDFERDPSLIIAGGIGGLLRCVVRDADLSFRTDEGQSVDIRTPILIAERLYPHDGRRQPVGHSLLGRDILGQGELTLAYRRPADLHFSNAAVERDA